MWQQIVEQQGFAITAPLLTPSEIEIVRNALNQPSISRSRAGVRHALGLPEVTELARDQRLLSIA